MKKENIVGFRISTYYTTNIKINDFIKRLVPAYAINNTAIAQSLADQIWLWIEFRDLEDKSKYLEFINRGIGCYDNLGNRLEAKNMFMHHEEWLTQEQIDHWIK